MRTISFYSYKGGVGRSLLLAHIARYLAGLGRRVVILDFDFDAPGIPALFGLNAFQECKAGFLDLFLENIGSPGVWDEFKDRLHALLLKPNSPLPMFSSKREEAWLRILPTGNPGTKKY